MESALTPSFLIVNLLFATVALGIGFAAGAWFLGGKSRKEDGVDESRQAKRLEETLAAERASMAAGRLRDLASGVATDVGDHNTRVEQISADLEAARNAPADQKGTEVAAALERIVEANTQLQQKLHKAEQQIHAQAIEIRAHESEARTDSLTQLANRRAFDSHLEQRVAEWSRTSTPISLIILDVDHFKKFNDTHGHQAGDEVLRKVAVALKDAAREMDVPCRYGGEEFAIILPSTSATNAVPLVERARSAIESMRVEFEGKSLNVTASFGLAEINKEDDCARLLKRADEALYAAKEAGRNRGYRHTGETSVAIADAPPKKTKKSQRPAADEVETQLLGKIPNRTLFAEELRRRIAASERSGEPLCVIAIGLTEYKSIAAEYGQGVAELTLDSLAQFLSSALRQMDLLARLGDGQFAIMLPAANAKDAELVSSRFRAALANCSVPMGQTSLQLTTNMGVAELEPNDTAATLVGRATTAMSADSASAEEPAASV